MKTINIGGVPEHFNLPWHLAKEEGLFENAGINLAWHDCPGGTGAMCRDVQSGKLDAAVVLSEGAVRFLTDDSFAKIIHTYVTSPLIWGVHQGNGAKNISKTFVISREGSGSHLMAYIYADRKRWDSNSLQFVEAGNLDGALQHLEKDPESLFLWEKFTTKPFVDNQQLQRIDECPTPWPCFVVIARNEWLEENREEAKALTDIVAERASILTQQDNRTQLIAERYALPVQDVAEWMNQTNWRTKSGVDQDDFYQIIEILHNFGVIKEQPDIRQLLA